MDRTLGLLIALMLLGGGCSTVDGLKKDLSHVPNYVQGTVGSLSQIDAWIEEHMW